MIFNRIVTWNKERNIPKKFDIGSEAGHIAEELSELLRSSNDSERVDALCDILVFATGALWKLGYNPTEAMNQTLLEIESRGGKFNSNTGKWQKEITGHEVKADYDLAKV